MAGLGVYRAASGLQAVGITVLAPQPDTRSAMHPKLSLIAAQEHIADLHRAADHDRLVHEVTTERSSHVVTAGDSDAATPVRFMRRLRHARPTAR
jgi:hypothetical protein